MYDRRPSHQSDQEPGNERKKSAHYSSSACAHAVSWAQLIKPRTPIGLPLRSVRLERGRSCRAGVVVVPELKPASRAHLVRRSAKEIFVRSADRDPLRRGPDPVGRSAQSFVLADGAAEHRDHCFVRSVTRSNEPSEAGEIRIPNWNVPEPSVFGKVPMMSSMPPLRVDVAGLPASSSQNRTDACLDVAA